MIPNTSTSSPKRTIWARIASRMIKLLDTHTASPNVQPSAQSAMAGDLITPRPEQRGHPLLTLCPPIDVLQQLFRQLVIVRQVPVPSMVTKCRPTSSLAAGCCDRTARIIPSATKEPSDSCKSLSANACRGRVPRDYFLQHPSRVISPTLLAGRNDVINRMHLPPIRVIPSRRDQQSHVPAASTRAPPIARNANRHRFPWLIILKILPSEL